MRNAVDHAIDAVGLVCPEPLMMVRNRVREMAMGETVSVVATDPSTVRDFTNFCRFMGHELSASSRDGDRFVFVIRKRGKALDPTRKQGRDAPVAEARSGGDPAVAPLRPSD